MKILLDHSTPRVLRRYLSDHVVDTAAAQGWSELSNGDLLEHAVEEGYEVLITTDQNMRYQQNIDTWPIGVVVILSNRWPLIQTRVGDVRAAVATTISRSGTWTSACSSVNRSGRYARFYSFTVANSGTHRIDLSSSQDTYMFLLSGSGKNGSVIERDDDDGLARDSRIERHLSAGTYTIEATTFSSNRTGTFTVTIVPPAPTPTPTPSPTATHTATATPTLVPTPTHTPTPVGTATPSPTPKPSSCPSGQDAKPGQPPSDSCPGTTPTPYTWCDPIAVQNPSVTRETLTPYLDDDCNSIDSDFTSSYAKFYRFTLPNNLDKNGASVNTQMRLEASNPGSAVIHPVLFIRDDFGNEIASTEGYTPAKSAELSKILEPGTYVFEVAIRQPNENALLNVKFLTDFDLAPEVEFRVVYKDNGPIPSLTPPPTSTPVPAGTHTPTVTPTPTVTLFEDFGWKIFTSAGFVIDVVGPQLSGPLPVGVPSGVNPDHYEFFVEVPPETGLLVDATPDADCDFNATPSVIATWAGRAHYHNLLRCGLGDNSSRIKIKARNTRTHFETYTNFDFVVPQSRHLNDNQLEYRVVVTTPFPTSVLPTRTPTPVPSGTATPTGSPTPTVTPTPIFGSTFTEARFRNAVGTAVSEWKNARRGLDICDLERDECSSTPVPTADVLTIKNYDPRANDAKPCGWDASACNVAPLYDRNAQIHLSNQMLYVKQPLISDVRIVDHQGQYVRTERRTSYWTISRLAMLYEDQKSLTATLIHELGHAAGLGHSSDDTDLMYYARRVSLLSDRDKDALGAIYASHTPHGAEEEND